MLLTRSELSEMAVIGADEGLEVSLFVGPREEYGIGGSVRSPEGMVLSGRLRGLDQLRYALEDILRAVDAGIRGFLIADSGLMQLVNRWSMRANCRRRSCGRFRPSSRRRIRLVQATHRHGGTTVNVPSDISLAELTEFRAASDAPIDLYLEAPDALGGMVRATNSPRSRPSRPRSTPSRIAKRTHGLPRR